MKEDDVQESGIPQVLVIDPAIDDEAGDVEHTESSNMKLALEYE